MYLVFTKGMESISDSDDSIKLGTNNVKNPVNNSGIFCQFNVINNNNHTFCMLNRFKKEEHLR